MIESKTPPMHLAWMVWGLGAVFYFDHESSYVLRVAGLPIWDLGFWILDLKNTKSETRSTCYESVLCSFSSSTTYRMMLR
jgi:hypothetical protein